MSKKTIKDIDLKGKKVLVVRISAATLWRAAIIPISALPLPVPWLRASATAVL